MRTWCSCSGYYFAYFLTYAYVKINTIFERKIVNIFLHISLHMFWVLKRTISLRYEIFKKGNTAMREASQLPGRGPTDADDAPASAS